MTKIPLGQPENAQLEFKQSDSLKHPETISREVVAMLNDRGGEVWIGVRESGGRAVAIDAMPEPERARQALRDHIVDSIEPSPRGEEVVVEPVRDEKGRAVLRVRVKPDESRKPYALLKGGGRHFVVRVGERTRQMSREEILQRRESESPRETELDKAVRELRKERDRRQGKREAVFWVGIQPVGGQHLDVQDRELWGYLQDWRRTGNRPHGLNFVNPYTDPTLRRDCLAHSGAGTEVEIRATGALNLEVSLESMRRPGEKQEISPYPLMEQPVSFFRLAARLYSDYRLAQSGTVVADAALFELYGWNLRPYSPDRFYFQNPLKPPRAFTEARDLVWERPLEFSCDDLLNEPDWCGFRLVRRIYEAFGYSEEKIPGEFNRETRRLVISQ